jgi:hypothetical protein
MGTSGGDAGRRARNYVKWHNGRLDVPAVKHSDSRSFVSTKDYDMTTHNHQVITRILVSAAVTLGSYVGGAAPAGADPNPIGTAPNPFGALSCSCRQTAPPGSPAAREETERGIREGLSASLPGRPSPTRPRRPQ